jgi:hypothetical protein
MSSEIPVAQVPLAYLERLLEVYFDFRAGRLVPAPTNTPQVSNPTPQLAPSPTNPAPGGVGETADAAKILRQQGLWPQYDFVHNNEFGAETQPPPEPRATKKSENKT